MRSPYKSCIPYYVLLIWEFDVKSKTHHWLIEFGSYDRLDCSHERDELVYGYKQYKKKNLKIKKLCSCAVSYGDIMEVAAKEPAPK